MQTIGLAFSIDALAFVQPKFEGKLFQIGIVRFTNANLLSFTLLYYSIIVRWYPLVSETYPRCVTTCACVMLCNVIMYRTRSGSCFCFSCSSLPSSSASRTFTGITATRNVRKLNSTTKRIQTLQNMEGRRILYTYTIHFLGKHCTPPRRTLCIS